MFIIKSTPDKTIDWPCTVEVAADGGKIRKFEFSGTFRLLGDDEKEALVESAKENVPADDSEEAANAWKARSVDGILGVMTGWKGVVDEHKTAIEFNRDNLLTAVRSVHGISILRAINTAIAEISTGARAKN